MDVDGLLLDMDGVLTLSWQPLPGAEETVRWLRQRGLPFRVITNTTTHPRSELAARLSGIGIEVEADEVVTAVVATAEYLRRHHPGAKVRLLSDGDASADLEDIRLVEEEPDVVVIGGAFEGFTYGALNRAFRAVMEGAVLLGMHRNLFWRTDEGWQLDGGAYIAGLEEATGRRAVICGKPAAEFFGSALSTMGIEPARAAMVGDDVVSDVLGAKASGLRGVLVRTGKFRAQDLQQATEQPDHVIGSIAALPELLASS
ncbi:MAG TPA: TIGR01458 family HAD-type hydrolase [Actinomycetota bacterium]|jgi:HAD superfamily hydrolase (TIGR01458 family)|nr:TIGR01458 family HAD-type hydrolase [Actinomycetota bacterium]